VHLALVDATRATPAVGAFAGADHRALPTVVYLPAVAGPAPLVVLAHGFDGHPRKFSDLATHWAGAGYAVAVPRFPVTNDELAALAGGPCFEERIADLHEQSIDVTFVLDELLRRSDDRDGELSGRFDPERIGLYGLSLGALTVWTTLLGPAATETRARALIQSDGGFPGAIDRLADLTIPVFMAQSDVDELFAPEFVQPQFAAVPTAKYLLVLHGAAHAAVAENTPTPADEAYRVATTVFWDRYLGGRADEPFPDSIVIAGVTSFIDESGPDVIHPSAGALPSAGGPDGGRPALGSPATG
jgi:predicted dienelactone hydrolase